MRCGQRESGIIDIDTEYRVESSERSLIESSRSNQFYFVLQA